jgi:hypothetical protein
VLGLEAEDLAAAARLTEALRKVFAARGLTGGQEITLVELRLTMGCEAGDIGCLSEGGKTIGVDKLVYGHLWAVAEGGYMLEVKVLDVRAQRITHEHAVDLGADDLDQENVRRTATHVVAGLYGEEGPTLASTEELESADHEVVPEPRDEPAGLVWSRSPDTARWKIVGVGVSGGLTVAWLATAMGTSLAIRDEGPIYDELIEAAEDSLTDAKPSNDIDPNTDEDLCKLARAHPVGDPDPNTVTNGPVTEVCNKADRVAAAATASWVATGVFAASTAAFATLLFVRRESPAARAFIRRGVTLGASPTRSGGLALAAGMRF